MQSGCSEHQAFSAGRDGSAEPRFLLPFFVAAFLVSLAIGLGFALVGAWPVLPFSGAEVLALGIALRLAVRRSPEHERPAGRGARRRWERRRAARRFAGRTVP